MHFTYDYAILVGTMVIYCVTARFCVVIVFFIHNYTIYRLTTNVIKCEEFVNFVLF